MNDLVKRIVEIVFAGAALIGCVAYGHSIGKDTNEGLVNFLREKNQQIEKIEEQLRSEVASLKLELQARSTATQSPTVFLGSASNDIARKPSPSVDAEQVILNKGATAQLFNGKISISLVGIDYAGSPRRQKVIATVGSPGKKNVDLNLIDVGFAEVFGDYEVRLINSNTLTATFLVTNLEGKD